MTDRMAQPANSHDRHSGARRLRREPGIHNHDRRLWIPGLRQVAHPGMTSGGHVARLPLPTLRFLALAALALFAPDAPAFAQGKLDARYEVTLAGIPVGKGSWVVDIADDAYSASASGGT